MVMKVMFDSNIWQKVVCPDDYISDPQYGDLCKIHQSIEEGKIEAFLSETMFTLENVKKADRKSKMGSMTAKIETTVNEVSGGAHVRIVMGPNPADAVSFDDNPFLMKYALETLRLGFNIVRLPRIGMLENKDLKGKLYNTAEDFNERASSIGEEIEKRGAGFAQIRNLVAAIPGNSMNEKIKNAPESDAKKIAKAIAEWADGDSVAISIALGCDCFCTRDEAHGAGQTSVLGASNVAWLNTDYGFVVKKPEELASML